MTGKNRLRVELLGEEECQLDCYRQNIGQNALVRARRGGHARRSARARVFFSRSFEFHRDKRQIAQSTNSTPHVVTSPGIEPRPHKRKASTISSTPPLLPWDRIEHRVTSSNVLTKGHSESWKATGKRGNNWLPALRHNRNHKGNWQRWYCEENSIEHLWDLWWLKVLKKQKK